MRFEPGQMYSLLVHDPNNAAGGTRRGQLHDRETDGLVQLLYLRYGNTVKHMLASVPVKISEPIGIG